MFEGRRNALRIVATASFTDRKSLGSRRIPNIGIVCALKNVTMTLPE